MSEANSAARLDEVALRRPGFHEGARVVLADGQEWALPELWHRFVPAFDEEKGTVVDLPLGTKLDVAEVLVRTGRAIPAAEWVDFLVRQKSDEALEALI